MKAAKDFADKSYQVFAAMRNQNKKNAFHGRVYLNLCGLI